MSDSTCDHQIFFSNLTVDEKCSIAKGPTCAEDFDFINFASMVYCGMNGSWGGFIPLGLFFGMLIFRFRIKVYFIINIGSFHLLLKNTWLLPLLILPSGLTYRRQWVQLLFLHLQMGNNKYIYIFSAGDLVTALVASSTPGGINYNIGSLFGAGVFVTTLVVGLTILNSGDLGVQLAAPSIWRDVGLYVVATLSIIIFGAIGTLGLVASIILLCLYGVLVIATFIIEKINPCNLIIKNYIYQSRVRILILKKNPLNNL